MRKTRLNDSQSDREGFPRPVMRAVIMRNGAAVSGRFFNLLGPGTGCAPTPS
jgi:hypothetical protein